MIDPLTLSVVAGLAVVAILAPIGLPRASWPWAAALATILFSVVFDLLVPFARGDWFFVAYGVFAVSPLAVFSFFVWAGEGGKASRFGLSVPRGEVGTLVVLALVLDAVYFVLTLEPGLLQGFVVPGLVDRTTFAALFLTTPLLALGQEAVFRGYVLTKLSGRYPFRFGLFASAALFSVVGFNPFLVRELPLPQLLPLVFLDVLVPFVLGIFLGLFFYKSNWNLTGPWVFRSVLLGAALLFPIGVRGVAWETEFVLELIAAASLIVLVFVALREPRFQARHYLEEARQPRRRTLMTQARARQEAVPLVAVFAVAVVLVAFAGPVGDISSRSPVRVLAVATGSMVPTLARGTLVIIDSVASPGDLRVGDVVAYNAAYLSSQGPVVHRIVAISTNGSQTVFTFKGDANPSPDPRPVQFDQVVGRVVASVPYLGYLILSPELTIAILVAIVIAGFYRAAPPGERRVRPRPVIPLGEGRT